MQIFAYSIIWIYFRSYELYIGLHRLCKTYNIQIDGEVVLDNSRLQKERFVGDFVNRSFAIFGSKNFRTVYSRPQTINLKK